MPLAGLEYDPTFTDDINGLSDQIMTIRRPLLLRKLSFIDLWSRRVNEGDELSHAMTLQD